MNAEVNSQQPCQCELCKPNWYLGESGDFEATPATKQLSLEEIHKLKIIRNEQERVRLPVLAIQGG